MACATGSLAGQSGPPLVPWNPPAVCILDTTTVALEAAGASFLSSCTVCLNACIGCKPTSGTWHPLVSSSHAVSVLAPTRCDCPRGWSGDDCSQPPEDLEDVCKCYSFNKPYMVCFQTAHAFKHSQPWPIPLNTMSSNTVFLWILTISCLDYLCAAQQLHRWNGMDSIEGVGPRPHDGRQPGMLRTHLPTCSHILWVPF